MISVNIVDAVARAMYPNAFRRWEECQGVVTTYPATPVAISARQDQTDKWEPKMEAARERARRALSVATAKLREVAETLPYPASEGVWKSIEALSHPSIPAPTSHMPGEKSS